jgi:hypothetical protein
MYLSILLLQQAVSTSVTRWAVAAEINPQSVLDGQRGHIFRNRRLFADDQIEESLHDFEAVCICQRQPPIRPAFI